MISVIIPGYNVSNYVSECLDALLAQTMPRDAYEIIYVDDASEDDSQDVVGRYGGVRLLALPENRGQATARNLGLQEARGEIILFTDADCVPAHDWIEAMLRPFEDPEIAGTKGIYRTRQRSLIARFAQVEYESRYDIMRRAHYIDFIDTYSAGYRAEVLRQHGGFDPSFRIDEDQELSFRLAEAGHKMVFNPEAIVYHRHAATLQRYLKRKYEIGYWKAFVLGKHPDKALNDSHTPQRLKLQLALAAVICLGLLLTCLRRQLWPVPALAALAVAAAAAPLIGKAAQRDPLLGFASPFLVMGRALALGMGLAVGLANIARGKGVGDDPA